MFEKRIIPVLLCDKMDSLVKTTKFKDPVYVGDPVNAVKIFNEKEVDELIFLDISATKENRGPNLAYIEEIATECFMPLCYGGGVRTLDDISNIIKTGVEKVAINTASYTEPDLIRKAAEKFGSSTIVASIDVKKDLFGSYHVVVEAGKKSIKMNPVAYAQKVAAEGAGEILLNAVDKDGTLSGFDLKLIEQVAHAVEVPVIACGGAGQVDDFKAAFAKGASAAAAGALFVFTGKHRAVLINYLSKQDFTYLNT